MSASCFSAGAGRVARNLALFLCAVVCANYSLRAGVNADGTETPDGKSTVAGATEQTPEYKNWIEVGIGGNIIDGDAAQFKQEHRISGDVFGGIQDLHLERTIGKNATLTVDGHAIFDNHDYDVKIDLSQPGLGYIRGGYTEFRSWYDDNGGFSPAGGGTWFRPRFHELTLDRGIAWVELGLRMPDWPEITIHYSHEFRDGDKDSTSWGDTNLTPVGTRKIAPAFRNIDETRDIFSFDASKTFANTDIDLGMRYEHNNNDDRLQLERGAGQLPPAVTPPGQQRFITQRDQSDLDLFNGHVITETRFSDTFWFTAGYSYTTLGSDLAGSRIYGSDYNSMYGSFPTIQFRDEGFLNLAGTSEVDEHVVNANLFWMPMKDLTLLSGFRYTHEAEDSWSSFLSTNTNSSKVLLPPVPESADTSQDFDNYAERFEARYTGIANWLFWAEGEWTEENGTVHEHAVSNGSDEGMLNKDTSLLGQKYTIGANWYAMPALTLSSQYYYQAAEYDNDIKTDLTGANQRLLSQDWTTNDFNIRMTYRPNIPAPLGTLSMTTRYDFMQTLVSGMWAIDPAGTKLAEEHTALITSHVIGETLTWNPLARLYLQGTLSYVLDETKTPANNIILTDSTPSVLNFQNDYWTVTGGAGFIIDNKTDFHVDYTYYRADDYVNNIQASLPYGAGATEHTVSASISRQLTPSVRLMLRYAFFHYTDQTSGGHNDYEAHSIFSSLQYRF
jgi:hypothetical protein